MYQLGSFTLKKSDNYFFMKHFSIPLTFLPKYMHKYTHCIWGIFMANSSFCK